MNGEEHEGEHGDNADDAGVRPAVMTLPPETSSVVAARRRARELLASWNAEVFDWAASQLVSELATNAVLHAGTSFEVALTLRGSRLRCEVSDTSPRPPRLRHYSAEATTGRGMQLVERLSTAWGIIPRPDGGKTVWFELDPSFGDSHPEPDLDSFTLLGDMGLGDMGPRNVRTGHLDGAVRGAA